jgi:hypothetical protein
MLISKCQPVSGRSELIRIPCWELQTSGLQYSHVAFSKKKVHPTECLFSVTSVNMPADK